MGSPIWLMPEKEFRELVERSKTVSEILDNFDLKNKGGNYKTVKRRVLLLGMDYSRFRSNIGKSWVGHLRHTKVPLESVLVEHSTYCRSSLKKRLLKEKKINHSCAICGVGSTWQNKPLVLVLDHINGVPDDNRIQNLRFLCPNCNSQQETFAGRGLKKHHNCIWCGVGIGGQSKTGYCRRCGQAHRYSIEKRDVDIEGVSKMIDEKGYSATGRLFGVSGNAVKKWIRKGCVPGSLKNKITPSNDNFNHGSSTSYTYHRCRCSICRQAHTERRQKSRGKRKQSIGVSPKG